MQLKYVTLFTLSICCFFNAQSMQKSHHKDSTEKGFVKNKKKQERKKALARQMKQLARENYDNEYGAYERQAHNALERRENKKNQGKSGKLQ